MSVKLAVCVPYRAGSPTRDANWSYLRQWWEASKLPLYTGDSDGDLNAAAARNRAAALAGDWDAALFIDADCLLGSHDQAWDALAKADLTGGYVACYDSFHYLGEDAAAAVLAGAEPLPENAYFAYTGVWLVAFAIARPLWEQIGGFDSERFTGIDGEDVAFFHAASHYGTIHRVTGPAFHLYHTPRH